MRSLQSIFANGTNFFDVMMSYPLMDALYSAIFRITLEELAWLEIKRHGCTADMLTPKELLERIWCRHGLSRRLHDLLNSDGRECARVVDNVHRHPAIRAARSLDNLDSNEPDDDIADGFFAPDVEEAFDGPVLVKSATITKKGRADPQGRPRRSRGKSSSRGRDSAALNLTLHRVVTSKDKTALVSLLRSADYDLDLSTPMRDVTPLAQSLYLQATEMTKELLIHLAASGQLQRCLNVASIDNVGRRETPVITAVRTGQLEALESLIQYKDILDLESRDGEGKTALWHAVRTENVAHVCALIGAGAKVFYENQDLACPLQLASKTMLLKNKGRRLVRILVSHGANVDYVDHALRNALYWSIYNCCGEVTTFLINAGARIRPWSWLEDEALPTSITEHSVYLAAVRNARNGPAKLVVLATTCFRRYLMAKSSQKSIYPLIDRLNVAQEIKERLRLFVVPEQDQWNSSRILSKK